MCYPSHQIAPHPVPIIYASPPLHQTQADQAHNRHQRPELQSFQSSSCSDGRSLTEVINAARKASLDEQPKRSSKSPASINETYQSSNPHSRRMSFDDPSAASLGHSEPNHPRLSSAGSRADYFSDPHYTYGGLVDLK
ncbi:uncharacterized protein PGTG_00224 [Puccinia graminis f. sp. tritici CRL 75-36-700-3]|uniref:Uncharacterized protein n=1 Tax=Puccinia graminis f. sp. tritici (strain CRL 75-36-700-3 / race SCCL) TaxID=418459 RepID=E3JPS8_PUCGT|nr:uncharacterized protein PGTG_00224 [Puccinia graminis f. sp. tritici CRL 75-36-700-3]EFP74268.1 hypothetical protein PGTG_00224 [Puccinia graminis f. sp. tritici CRL 75-36-700-3]